MVLVEAVVEMTEVGLEVVGREARALGLLIGGLDAARGDAWTALAAADSQVQLSHLEVAP